MQAKLIDERDRVYAVIFDTGAEAENLAASSFTAIGAAPGCPRRRHDPRAVSR